MRLCYTRNNRITPLTTFEINDFWDGIGSEAYKERVVAEKAPVVLAFIEKLWSRDTIIMRCFKARTAFEHLIPIRAYPKVS